MLSVWHQARSPRRSNDSEAPFYKWFEDGELNVSYNCLDRHVEARPGRQDRASSSRPMTAGHAGQRTSDLLEHVSAGWPMHCGRRASSKGDRVVVIYMPMSVEGVDAMQACARIGATHSVVFGGFSAQSLRDRIEDAGAVML